MKAVDIPAMPGREEPPLLPFVHGLIWVINGPWVVQQRLPLLPRERTSSVGRTTSEKCHKRKSRFAPLFSHLVRAGEQRRRNFETQRLCGFTIDEKLKPGRLLDGKICRLG